MSSKNLKVYKMTFITELKRLFLNVKFACQIKMTWKRSNQSAQSSLVPLKNGVVEFNQTLRMPVNMYFNTTSQSFVQKKCLYSFTIATEKGEKSAGSVTIDLAQILNKRVYELDQTFTLQKCPVNGTKVEMKIHYQEQSTEQGYDSMSCISATNPMDSSSASIDLSQLAPTKSNISQKESQEQTQKSQKKSDFSISERQQRQRSAKKEQIYTTLDPSDVLQTAQKESRPHNGTRIGQNIKTINTLTNKINQFVNDKSKNIKFQIEGFKRKINSVEEQLLAQRIAKEKIQAQLTQQKQKNATLSKQFQNFKDEAASKMQGLQRKSAELETKQSNSQQLIKQIEQKMSQSGQSQSHYLEQLKANHQTTEAKLNQQIQTLRGNLVQEKKNKNELTSKLTTLQRQMRELQQKFQKETEKNSTLEDDMRRKESELENTRINLQKAFQNLVAALNGVV